LTARLFGPDGQEMDHVELPFELLRESAGFFRRVFAFAIDGLAISLICILLAVLLGWLLKGLNVYTRLIGAGKGLLYFGILNSDDGSPGKRAMHIEVETLDNRSISYTTGLIRALPVVFIMLFSGWALPILSRYPWLDMLINGIVLGLVFALLYLLIFNRKSGQGLDDLLVKSISSVPLQLLNMDN
jgi:uncharacterized RDD family membrane protein YckC